MEFNVNKCHVMEKGKSEKRLNWKYKIGSNDIKKVQDKRQK